MNLIISLLLIVCLSHAALSQSVSYERTFEGGPKITFVSNDRKKYDLLKDGNKFETSSIDKLPDIQTNIIKKVRDELLKTFPAKVAQAFDFAEKFAQKVMEGLASKDPLNEVLDMQDLSPVFRINKMLVTATSFEYYLSHISPDGGSPTTLLSRNNDEYVFDVAGIKASADKDVIISLLPDIIRFIQENDKLKLPQVYLVDDGKKQEVHFDDGKSTTQIALTAAQFAALKGEQRSQGEGNTYYNLKGLGKEEENAEEKVAIEAKPANETIATYVLIAEAHNYTLSLEHKEDAYYVKVKGPKVTQTTDAKGNVTKVTSAAVSQEGKDNIPALVDNEEGFVNMVNGVMKVICEDINTDDAGYQKNLKAAYLYFSGKVEKKAAEEKHAGFTKKIIEDSKASAIENEEEVKAKVGTIAMKKGWVKIYENDVVVGRTKVNKVRFSIESGKLSRRKLIIETDKGIFRNWNSPIPAHKISTSKRANDLLCNGFRGSQYVLLGDVLSNDSASGYFADDADNVVLEPAEGKDAKDLTAQVNLNSIVNFSIYTDLAGLLGRRPNGLLMSDVTGRFITNAGNVFGDATLISFIEANVAVSKFDSKFRSLDSTFIKPGAGGQADTVDRMKLMQTAWLRGSMKFNVISIKTFTNQYFSLNIGTRINVVNGDSLYKKETDIIMFDYFPELSYSINRFKNFGMDISTKWIFQRMADKERFANKSMQHIFNSQIAFFYYPFKNPSSTLYLRFNYFANKEKDANNFYQLQFGWKSGLKLSGK